MQRFAWWAKLLFVLANAGIASYFANPFSGFTGFIGWLLSFGASAVISGILLSGILLLIGLAIRGITFFVPTEAEAGKGKNKATAASAAGVLAGKLVNPDECTIYAGNYFSASGDLEIRYRDNAGKQTQRIISVRSAGDDIRGGIYAYCTQRQAMRTFLYARILSAIDVETGELLVDLPAWLDTKRQDSADDQISKAIDALLPELEILLYVSRADGRMSPAERSRLLDFLISQHDSLANIDRQLVDDFIKKQCTDSVDENEFLQYLQDVSRSNPARAAALLETATAIVATQKTVHAAERKALDQMAAAFSAAAFERTA